MAWSAAMERATALPRLSWVYSSHIARALKGLPSEVLWNGNSNAQRWLRRSACNRLAGTLLSPNRHRLGGWGGTRTPSSRQIKLHRGRHLPPRKPLRRSGLTHSPARVPLAHLELAPQMQHPGPAADQAQKFPREISLSISIGNCRSATIRFSRSFSSRSRRSPFASSAFMPVLVSPAVEDGPADLQVLGNVGHFRTIAQ